MMAPWPDEALERQIRHDAVEIANAVRLVSATKNNENVRALLNRIRELEKREAELTAVCRNVVDKCPICDGSGELVEAVQAWDVPGAPTPECSWCKPAREALKEKTK
jgi:hypothetical protein